jgi:hypothetical protein
VFPGFYSCYQQRPPQSDDHEQAAYDSQAARTVKIAGVVQVVPPQFHKGDNVPEGYTVNDRRGQEKIMEVCRVCGSKDIHTTLYNQPTMGCIEFLRKQERLLDIYKHSMNEVDDYFEYQYKVGTIDDIKEKVDMILARLNEAIKKWGST